MKTILEKYKINDAVEMVLEDETILLKPIVSPRKGWDQEFSKMHSDYPDELLIDYVFKDENLEEWRN
jgi:antitoxin MazE